MGTNETTGSRTEATIESPRGGSDAARSSEAAISELLSDRRRRYVLYYLAGCEYAASVDEITEQVAVWETRTQASDIDSDVYEDVGTTVVHQHLPKLVDFGVVAHDEDSDVVTLADETDELLDALHRAAEREQRAR